MSLPRLAELSPGDAIPALELPPLSRHTLALYCGASGDHNPVHVDIDFAREVAGLDDVIGHGMLTMAWLGRMLTDWVPQHWIRRFSTRFLAPTRVGDRISCRGTITAVTARPEPLVRLALQASRADGTVLARGEAEILWARGA